MDRYELIAVAIVVVLVAAIGAGFWLLPKGGEQVCAAGYVHIRDANSSLRQVLDEHGRGSKCEMV
jgi:hypothetical protein